MSYGRREEGFRYTFPTPLEGTYRIVKIDGAEVETRAGELKVIDISLKGMKIVTPLNIVSANRTIEIVVSCTINNRTWVIPATLLWQQPSPNEFIYGIRSHLAEAEKEKLVVELKRLARRAAGMKDP